MDFPLWIAFIQPWGFHQQTELGHRFDAWILFRNPNWLSPRMASNPETDVVHMWFICGYIWLIVVIYGHIWLYIGKKLQGSSVFDARQIITNTTYTTCIWVPREITGDITPLKCGESWENKAWAGLVYHLPTWFNAGRRGETISKGPILQMLYFHRDCHHQSDIDQIEDPKSFVFSSGWAFDQVLFFMSWLHWDTHFPEDHWLVVEPPLWKIWKSIGMMIPNIWENKNVPNHQPDQRFHHLTQTLVPPALHMPPAEDPAAKKTQRPLYEKQLRAGLASRYVAGSISPISVGLWRWNMVSICK